MKKIAIACAALLMAACASNDVKTLTGVIEDASMNTVTVKAEGAEPVTFSTVDADKTEANGLLLGSSITVSYKGELVDGVQAVKVVVDTTSRAVVD